MSDAIFLAFFIVVWAAIFVLPNAILMAIDFIKRKSHETLRP